MTLPQSFFTWRILSPLQLSSYPPLRKQMQLAIQLVAAVGRIDPAGQFPSQLTREAHFNGLAGQWIRGKTIFRSLISFRDFSLYLVDENVNTLGNFPLLGKSFKQALVWLEEQIIRQKLSSAQLKLDLSYDFPFSVSEMSSPILEVSLAETEALGVYYEDVEFLLSKLTAPIGHFSEILVQPSTMEMYRDLILKETGERETDTMLTFGLSPGDSEYPLPYLFVKTRPHIMKMDRLLPLSQGHWHTGDWTGAVLPCSKLWGQQSQQQLANSFMEESLERLASRLLE